MKQVARKRRYVPPKRRLNFNGLHAVITQKTEVFIFQTLSSIIIVRRVEFLLLIQEVLGSDHGLETVNCNRDFFAVILSHSRHILG